MTKFCKDCKFFYRSFGDKFFLMSAKYANCSNPAFVRETESHYLVSGNSDKKREFGYCRINREYEHLCGPDAKGFEPK